jgi:hypothetical protein
MKVFGCTRRGDWEGGIILVVANSRNEAFSIAAHDKDAFVHFLFLDRKGRYVDYIEQAAKIISKTYPIEHWTEYANLTANVDKPQVILDEGYAV